MLNSGNVFLYEWVEGVLHLITLETGTLYMQVTLSLECELTS